MKKFLLYFFLFFFFFFSSVSFAQQSKMDSLLIFLSRAKQDTNKVNALNALSKEYRIISAFPTALHYAEQAKSLAEQIQLPNEKMVGWPKGFANSLNSIGLIDWNQGEYNEAFDYFSRALTIREKIGDKIPIGESYNNMGLIYSNQGNNEKAVESYMKSLKIMEECGNKKGMGNAFNNLGLVYNDQGNYDLALKNFYKTLKIREELNDKLSMSACYNNIGLVYENQGITTANKTMANDKYQKALESHFKSLKIKEELGDKLGIGASYNNIGIIYSDLENISPDKKIAEKYSKKALESYFNALSIAKEIKVKDLICNAALNIANAYLKENKLDEGYDFLNQTLQVAKEIGKKNIVQGIYLSLSNLYEKKQDYKQALEYHKRYNDLKDTLLNETTSKQIAEMNAKYDTEKKDKELIQKDAEITKQQAESEKRQTQRNAFVIGFGLVLLLSVFIFRSYRHKQEANRILEIKNEAINQQNIEIAKKNTLITDSIEYAKDIQQAILPSESELKKTFQKYFILYKPKDIVSGDFYWIHEQADHILFAVADCTGHGVPGAFMSLLGYNLLKEAAGNKKDPSQILDELNRKVLETLKQESNDVSAKYGMDIALIRLDKKMNRIEYAGAHNSLYIYRNKECIQLKADARSIGTMLKEDENAFANQSCQLEKGDMLYLFSDGYIDQKGGPEGKQFFSKSFKKLLQSICGLDLSEQQQELDHTITNWQGNKKQTDDILVVGIRV